ncbi:MAG: hypothetical protein ACYCX4_05800 [Bacillota bacterium]
MRNDHQSVGVLVTADASGAARAAEMGYVVVIVDVIHMSTALESALECGSLSVYGASPDGAMPPVKVNPEKVGWVAGCEAVRQQTEVIVIGEPRIGPEEARVAGAASVIAGINRAGAKVAAIVPNIGADVAELVKMQGQVVVAVSASGGVAFDAAYSAGGVVLTGTVARTARSKGIEPAMAAVRRAILVASARQSGIAVVAASANAWEDVLAAQYIAGLFYQQGFR